MTEPMGQQHARYERERDEAREQVDRLRDELRQANHRMRLALDERDAARRDYRALREGLVALADEWERTTGKARPAFLVAADELRALLAPSPAEGTSEAICCGDHDEDGGRPCNGCPERSRS